MRTKTPVVTEAQWSKTFRSLFEMLGYRGYHTWMSKFSEKGFPDWTLCSVNQQRLVFVELKSETGKLSEAQEYWRDLLQSCGQEWYCWRPSDFEAAADILKRRIDQ